MGTGTITVNSNQSFRDRVKSAFAGKRQDEQISFESFDLLWKVLAPNRMAPGGFPSHRNQYCSSTDRIR